MERRHPLVSWWWAPEYDDPLRTQRARSVVTLVRIVLVSLLSLLILTLVGARQRSRPRSLPLAALDALMLEWTQTEDSASA